MRVNDNQQQQILTGGKAILKPGVFSNYSLVSKVNQGDSFLNSSFQHSKSNPPKDTLTNQHALTQSADVNLQAFQLIQQHLQQSQKQKSRQNPQPKCLSEKFQLQLGKQQDKPNEFLQALLEQNINKTRRHLKTGEMKSILVPDLYNYLNENQNQQSSPQEQIKRKVVSPQRRGKCPSQHQIPKPKNESEDKVLQKNQSFKTSQERYPQPQQYLSKRRNDSLDRSGRVHTNVSVDPQLPQNPPKTSDKQTPKNGRKSQQVRSGKKLNFNLGTPGKSADQDNIFLNTSNQMANMIIENILNKEDYYENLKKENKDLKDLQFSLQKQNQDLKKSLLHSEKFSSEIKVTLDGERSKYHKELIKLQDKLSVVKQLQSAIQVEKQKNEQLQLKTKEQSSLINQLKDIMSSVTLSSIEFLGNFQQQSQTLERTQSFESIMPAVLHLLQNALHLVFETIQNTQQVKLLALKDCHIPENFDFQCFFQLVEKFYLNNLRHERPVSDTMPNDSLNESQEMSFRQKPSSIGQLQLSLPISQVQNKQIPSRDFSIQDQFNTFLEIQDDIEELPLQIQIGSPYFNQAFPQFACDKEQAKNMPLQVSKSGKTQNHKVPIEQMQNHLKKESQDANINDTDRHDGTNRQKIYQQQPVVSFPGLNRVTKHISIVKHNEDPEQNENIYDSVFQELIRTEPKQKINSMHTMGYLDQQANRSFEYEKKKQLIETQNDQKRKVVCSSDKENQQHNQECEQVVKNQYSGRSQHCIDTWAIAKTSFRAQKVNYSYQQQQENDLTFSKGDRIQILKKTQNGSWIGFNNFYYKKGCCKNRLDTFLIIWWSYRND